MLSRQALPAKPESLCLCEIATGASVSDGGQASLFLFAGLENGATLPAKYPSVWAVVLIPNVVAGVLMLTLVSLSLRLKDLLGPVARVKKKK